MGTVRMCDMLRADRTYLNVQAIDVCNGVDCDCAQAKLFACPDHSHCDLAAVGYQDFREFCRDNMLTPLWPPRAPLGLKCEVLMRDCALPR